MPLVPSRQISNEEVAVLAAALTRSQTLQPHHISLESLNYLCVHSKCACGCASIGFLPENEKAPEGTRLLADGQGLSAYGQEVGILVYGTAECVVEMEVYWYEISGAPLPLARTIGEYTGQSLPTHEQQP